MLKLQSRLSLPTRSRFLTFAALALGTSLVSAAPATKLKMNGKIASVKLKTIGGVAYVPVADVAKALGQKVVPMAGGLELKTASGTFQVSGLAGKIGSVIQTKKFSFQVLSVETPASYSSRYLKLPSTYTPDSPNETLFIVNCRIKNTLSKAQGPVLNPSYAGNTAIADFDGQSYAPKDYDSRLRSDFSGASMLPGSKVDLALIFSIPKTAKIKDLVFTMTEYFDPNFKGPDVRISLQ